MSRQLEFEKIRNIRDLGGMKTSGGKHIKSGKLIRCGQLSDLSESDREKMAGIVDMIVDFRTEKEREEKPDVSLSGVSYRHIPIVDNLSAGISREEDADRALMERLLFKPEEAKMYMCDMYRSFVSETSLSQYESFFRLLLNRYDKAVLWHCTAGKDRAGIASAIVEKLLDIPEDEIIADYLSTNTYLEPDIIYLTKYIKAEAKTDDPRADESLRFLFSAKQEYINAYYSEVMDKFGGFDALVKDGLHLTESEILKLRDIYLE